MNKILSKTVKKGGLLSILMAAIVVIGAVLTAIFGVPYAATLKDANTVTVTVNQAFYNQHLDLVEGVCDETFANCGLKAEYSEKSLNGADGEVIYYFAGGDDVAAKTQSAKEALRASFAEKTNETDGAWKEYVVEITVRTAKEAVQDGLPVWYFVRTLIAVVVFAALAFAYASVRFGWTCGITVGISTLCGAFVSAAVVLLARIPFTNSTLYVFGVSALLSAVFSVCNANKVRANKSDEDVTATREIGATACTLGGALVLVGAIATWSTRWFAVAALVALIVTTFVGLVYSPALYTLCKKQADKKALENAQYGKQRAEKQERKAAKNAAEQNQTTEEEK